MRARLVVYLIVWLWRIMHFTIAMPRVLQFCGDNQLLSFSVKMCPGGVFFKVPINLTEPCYCANKYLEAYTVQCDNQSQIPSNVCWKERQHDNALVRFLHPTAWNVTEAFKFSLMDAKCHSIHKRCKKAKTSSFIQPVTASNNILPAKMADNVYDKPTDLIELKQNPHHRQKRQASINQTDDEKLRERIQQTIKLLNQLQLESSPDSIKPKSMSFQLLAETVKIFNRITPSVIVKDEVVNSIMTLFMEKYSDLELPGYSGLLIVDDQVDKEIFESVLGSLEECTSRASDPSQEFEFVTTHDSCPPTVTHVVHEFNTFESGFKRFRYELGQFMPVDRKYVPEKEDLVLGALWKIFDAVNSYCFTCVFSYRFSDTLTNYFAIISNIFTNAWTVNDYFADNGQGTLMYTSRIAHENLTTLMNNLDFMTEAVHLLSRYKTFFMKPVSNPNAGDRMKREDATTVKPTSESPIFANRNKRSIRKDKSWNDLEIWDGRAYCLQISNPDYPPDVTNTFPSIDELCKLS